MKQRAWIKLTLVQGSKYNYTKKRAQTGEYKFNIFLNKEES